MLVLMVKPYTEPELVEIDGSLRSMQEAVGGYIEAVHPFPDPVVLICDEDGLIKDTRFNRRITEDLWIFGDFFLCGENGDELTSIPQEYIDKYMRLMARRPWQRREAHD